MINCVTLMGRLTKAPELKTTGSGISVCSFTIAVDRNYTRPGEDRQTDFLTIVAWRKTAEFVCQYFGKGDMIALTGEIQTREYEKDGQRKTVTEIIANNVSFCGNKTENKTPSIEVDEELPF